MGADDIQRMLTGLCQIGGRDVKESLSQRVAQVGIGRSGQFLSMDSCGLFVRKEKSSLNDGRKIGKIG